MADLYRKSSLEKLSSPDQLDKIITITSPLSWLALVGITILIAATVIWSIYGSLPTTITAEGIIISPVSTNAVYSSETGTVTRISVKAGMKISVGNEVAVIKTSSGNRYQVLSTQNGIVSEVLVKNGAKVYQGSEVVRISPITNAKQVAICYVSMSDVKRLVPGMDVLIYPKSVDKQKYGHMRARISNIDTYAATKTNMSYVLGTDNMLAESFSKNGAVVSVTCELAANPQTVSGFYWSSKHGAQLSVPNGSLISSKIIIEKNAPITKFLMKLKEIWEG